VMVPAGAREVSFTFEPASYRRGKWISLATAIALMGILIVSIGRRGRH